MAINLLGLARAARQLVSGEAIVLKNIQTKKAKFVFLASDAGQATTKKFTDKCNSYGIPCSRAFTKSQLSQATGQSRTIIGVVQQVWGIIDNGLRRVSVWPRNVFMN